MTRIDPDFLFDLHGTLVDSVYQHVLAWKKALDVEHIDFVGLGGAARYYSPRYREGFALECRAIRHLREEMGFTNVTVMISSCRAVKKADRVLEVMRPMA